MDFITHLPNSFGQTVIWVICDRLTKFMHFLALPSHFTATDLAHRFTVEIFRLHGCPRSIVSDRDPLFLSKFWKEFFRSHGTTLKYSTSYHPQTNGQTEVVNRSVETYLRYLAGDHPRSWHKFLHLAEYWYNTTFHSAIQMTPFRALYGRDPPHLLDYFSDSVSEKPLEVALQQQEILQELKMHLQKSRISMEKQANLTRRDVTFQAGYWLDLPSSSRIHPIVHVALLKPYYGDHPASDLQPLPLPDLVLFEDDIIRDTELHNRNKATMVNASFKDKQEINAGHGKTLIPQVEDSQRWGFKDRDVVNKEDVLRVEREVPKTSVFEKERGTKSVRDSVANSFQNTYYLSLNGHMSIKSPYGFQSTAVGTLNPTCPTAQEITQSTTNQSASTVRIPSYPQPLPLSHLPMDRVANSPSQMPTSALGPHLPLNLEDKVPFGYGSSDMMKQRPNRLKKRSSKLKDFIEY
ncbi:uncharacterized protein LOC131619165 [Vicia villosa]|uniref:uncharacterized protein LOC131619165 n=1 Tax=Vicia villosa TaxID=3911 RepID=UPI00273C1995|nr:uncharacterized protein LOC131619165 [Vicia villosa]